MKKSLTGTGQRGFIKALMLIVIAVCILFIVFITLARYLGPEAGGLAKIASGISPSPSSSRSTSNATNPLLRFLDTSTGSTGSYGSYGSYGSGQTDIPASSRSPYAGMIALGGGNASYSTQPYEEYVTLENNGNVSVDISGFTLANAKGTRPIQTTSNSYIYPTSESASIGQGTEFLDPSGDFRIGHIMLRPNDSAIVTTGQPFSQFPFSIYASFRENMCDGYLKNYPFEPQLAQSCPNPIDDRDIRTVTEECYSYMQSLNSCEDPEKYDKANFDLETTQCKNFMTARLSYPRCVANHEADAGFSLRQWRIFLGMKRELWASQKETITLYDSHGLIVDRISY